MATTTCDRCGAILKAGARFCTTCGADSVPPATPAVAGGAVATSAPPSTGTESLPPSAPPSDRPDNRRLVLIAAVALIVTLLGRVAYSAATSEPDPPGEIVASFPVGPEGGASPIEGGGEIRVPEGALDDDQTITVRRTTIRDRINANSPFGGAIVIPAGAQVVYIFSPASLVFNRPITIVLPAPSGANQGIVFVSSDGQILFVQGSQTGSSMISVRVESFDFSGQGTSAVVQS